MSSERALDVAERVRLMRDGVINNSGFLVSGAVGLFLVPVMLRGLGAESYGLWIAALSVAGVVGLFDFGLSWSVTREVAASHGSETRGETARFVTTAGNAYLLLGTIGAVLLGTLGLPLSRGLHLSAASRKIAPTVFVLAGLGLFADRLLVYTTVVLHGLRRFDAINLLSIAGILLRAAGIVGLIWAGTGLLPVAGWQVVASTATALAGLVLMGRLQPKFRLRVGQFDWKLVRSYIPFGLASQLAEAARKIPWETTPVLIGLVLGSGWIAPYYVAQKFPMAVSRISWSAADALFPAVIQHQQGQGSARAREVLEVGTRWMVILAFPLCLGLWCIAPKLLEAWIGEAQPGAVLVLRLITTAVFADAVAACPALLLWGRGAMRTLLIILGCVVMASLGFSLALLPRIGIVGAAWGVLLPTMLGSLALLHWACRSCGARIAELLRMTFDGLLFPALACGTVVFSIDYVAGPGRWMRVMGTSLAGGAAYAVSLYLGGARQEERRLVHDAVGLMKSAIWGSPR